MAIKIEIDIDECHSIHSSLSHYNCNVVGMPS